MKGISHFVTGVAVSSFFPWSVTAAQEGNPLYFILGGAFGLLPDTLDFKFYRFFYKHDVYVDPDIENPSPQTIADEIAAAIDLATDENREVRLKLNTIRLGVDYWQQYAVRMDGESGEVQVRFGPVVNTGQVAVPGTKSEGGEIGRAVTRHPFHNTYSIVSTIDIFDGPSYSFLPEKEGPTEIHFLPWHRTWSHSLLTGVFFGLLVWTLFGWQAAIIVPLAFGSHCLEDQLGFLGSNLFWPITKKRFQGIRSMHATDGFPNLACVWLCTVLIFWNLYRFSVDPIHQFDLRNLLLYGAILPLAGIYLLGLMRKVLGYDDGGGEADSSEEWIEPSSLS